MDAHDGRNSAARLGFLRAHRRTVWPRLRDGTTGIQPTAPDTRVEPDHTENGRHVGGTWGVGVGPLNALEITAMLSDLMALIAPAQNELRRVRDELHLDAIITCVVEPTSTQTPEIRFAPDMIRWAAENDVAIAVELALPRP